MSEKMIFGGQYLCIEPGVFIAAEFKHGTGGEFVCITLTYPHGPNYPVLQKIRDITNPEWKRLKSLRFDCWYQLCCGYNQNRKTVTWMVLKGLPSVYRGGGQPQRSTKGKVSV